MIRKFLRLLMVALCAVASVFAQGSVDKSGVYRPTEEEIAKNKRIAELLRHPTFVTLRLISMRRDSPRREEPSTTPSPYTIDEWINFELFLTQNSTENLVIWSSVLPYYQYRPGLIRDGDVVPYSKEAQQSVERADKEPASGSGGVSTLVPGREYQSAYVKLGDWYDSPLPPGHYQLTVRKQFAWNGDWVESNPVTFQVMPRKTPSPISDGVSIRLIPQNAKGENKEKPYRIALDDYFAVHIINDSDQPVSISVIDLYYGHRLQLIKDGKLLPYSERAAKLIQSKDSDPRSVDIGTLIVPAKTTSQFDGVTLRQWYGPLTSGVYRLTDRRRFEIEGPWTKDSAELVFEIAP